MLKAKAEIVVDNEITLKRFSHDVDGLKYEMILANHDHLLPWLPWADKYEKFEDMLNFTEDQIKEFDAGRQFGYNIFYFDELVGSIDIHAIAKDDHHCDLGYWLDKKYTGKGIMTRTVKVLTDYAMKDLKMHRVVIKAAPENNASVSVAERLSFMQRYPQLIQRRDDLVLEEITLLNQMGRYEEAMQKLDAHIFHPWEGGEGKVPAQYQICRVELAKQAISKKDYERAIGLLNECLEYPHHLGEGKLYGAQENDFYYLLGVAYDALGQKEKARECWEEATKGPQEPAAAMYYNDAKPDKIFYQGLALKRLERDDEANGRFYRLINYGKQHIFEHQVMDYFAVSLPDLLIWEDSLDTKNKIHCKYMLALGFYGIGEEEKALKYLREVEDMDINHQGIQQFRSLITNLTSEN